jgi:hypothetical protein
MDMYLSNVEFDEKSKRVLVTVSYGEQQPDATWDRAKASVFIPWADSYEEIKRAAFEKAKAFLLRAASVR